MNKKEYLETLEAKLKTAEQVSSILDTKTWRDIFQPMIDKMISDTDSQVISRKEGYLWHNGTKANPKAQEESEYYKHLLWYKQALIDFNNRIWGYRNAIKRLRKDIGTLKQEGREPPKSSNIMLRGKY